MSHSTTIAPIFVICLFEDEQGESLTRHKIYRVLPDEKAAQHGYLRIIDDSGEDYLYSARFFKSVALTLEVEEAILLAA